MSLGNTSLHQQGDIPEVVKLPNDRIRVVRRFQKFTREDVDNSNLGSLMGDFGALDTTGEQISGQGYTDCRLISVEVDTRFNSISNADNAVLTKTYETLTSSFVEISDPTVEIAESGLKKITKVYRAVSGTTSSNTVGTTELATGELLASSKIEDNTAFAELTEVYLETGLITETTEDAPREFSQVVKITNVSTGKTPTVPAGRLIFSRDEDANGFKTYTRVTLKNLDSSASSDDDLTGVVAEYKDIVEVEEIGTVAIETQDVKDKDDVVLGKIAIPEHAPTRRKSVTADVKIEIVDTIPDTSTDDIAYNLGDASCSITSIKTTDNVQGGNTVTATSGIFTRSETGFSRNFDNPVSIQTYDGCFFTGTSPTSEEVDYQSSSTPFLDSDGDGIEFRSGFAFEKTELIASGANAEPASYKEFGIIKRAIRHVLTAVDGTKYYEVITYSIPEPTP